MYHHFNIQQFCVLPTQCIYVFCVDLRTNSHYFPYNINWLVFITETQCVYCAIRTGSLNACQINRDRLTFVVEKWQLDRFFLQYFRFPLSPFDKRPTLISTYCSYERDKQPKPKHLPKSNALSAIGENCTGRYWPCIPTDHTVRCRREPKLGHTTSTIFFTQL